MRLSWPRRGWAAFRFGFVCARSSRRNWKWTCNRATGRVRSICGTYRSQPKARIPAIQRRREVSEGLFDGRHEASDRFSEPLLISGVGKFTNASIHVVYLKASSSFLRGVWWKPDYPTRKYGFNPHVTIYGGNDGFAATEICKFLKKEQIELLCFNYVVRLHDRRLPELVFHGPGVDELSEGSDQVPWGRVRSGLIQRATEVARAIKQQGRQRQLF